MPFSTDCRSASSANVAWSESSAGKSSRVPFEVGSIPTCSSGMNGTNDRGETRWPSSLAQDGLRPRKMEGFLYHAVLGSNNENALVVHEVRSRLGVARRACRIAASSGSRYRCWNVLAHTRQAPGVPLVPASRSTDSCCYGPLRAYSLSFAARTKPAAAPSLPPPVETYFLR